MPNITQSEFARRHNVTRQAVNDWIRRGVVTLAPDGLLDEAAALAAIATHADPARESRILISGPAPNMTPDQLPAPTPSTAAPPPTENEAVSFHVAKTRRELAEAERAELKLKLERGDLISLELARRTWRYIMTVTSTRVMAVAAAPDVPEAFRATLTSRLESALQEIADHECDGLRPTL